MVVLMPGYSRTRAAWDYPDCPECDSEVFVSGTTQGPTRYKCHLCDVRFTENYAQAGT